MGWNAHQAEHKREICQAILLPRNIDELFAHLSWNWTIVQIATIAQSCVGACGATRGLCEAVKGVGATNEQPNAKAKQKGQWQWAAAVEFVAWWSGSIGVIHSSHQCAIGGEHCCMVLYYGYWIVYCKNRRKTEKREFYWNGTNYMMTMQNDLDFIKVTELVMTSYLLYNTCATGVLFWLPIGAKSILAARGT